MRILLTGHCGFIGSRLKEILETEHELFCIDVNSGHELNTCVLDYNADLVIHLAGKSGVRESFSNIDAYWYHNVEASKRLFNTFSNTRIIYASSSSAYEPHLNPYAASKLLVEHASKSHPNSLGLRFHTVYSDAPRKGMFFDKLLSGTLEYVTDHYRDFIHIEDVCAAILFCINKPKLTGVIDVGTGQSVYIPSIAPNLPIKQETPNERKYTQADTFLLSGLDFKPKYTVEKFLTNKGLDVKLQYRLGETS